MDRIATAANDDVGRLAATLTASLDVITPNAFSPRWHQRSAPRAVTEIHQ
jgi:hypothetical protein